MEYHPPVSAHTTAFAVQNTDEEVRRCSSSGGVFSALAMDILALGGWVCAAVYDDDFQVCHELTNSPERVAAMRGAKYTQSCAEHCFPRIKVLLQQEVPVLFVGTPCQCAALRTFLGGNDPRLLLVDMICHGVPSPTVWQRYLKERQHTDAPGKNLVSIDLRNKTTGWSRYRYSTAFRYDDDKIVSLPQEQDPFLRGFVSNLYLRPSCADCSSKGVERCSDLTLGDYWGIWDQHPEFDDDHGTSLLLVHSAVGGAAWQRIAPTFRFLTVTPEEAVAQNPSAVQSSVSHDNRELFFEQLSQKTSVTQWIGTCLTPRQEPLLRRLLSSILHRGGKA